MGIFTYSHEEGTSAYDLNDDVPQDEKERRAQEIMEVQQEISYEMNQEKIGKSLKRLLIKKKPAAILAALNLTVWKWIMKWSFILRKNLHIGEFYNVRMTKAYDYDLEGEVVN